MEDAASSLPDVAHWLEELAALSTQYDIFRFMKRLAEAYGARSFMVINLPPITTVELNDATVITNWPAELLATYDREGLLLRSPLLSALRACTRPMTGDLSVLRGDAEGTGERIAALFEHYGMERFALFPTHEPGGGRGAISFWGTRHAFSTVELLELHFLCSHVFDRLAGIRALDKRTGEALTARETDCLVWTSAGKTSAEIAGILELSEHTVNHYLNRAARKLDAANRTHAVAKALKLGLIV